LAARPTAIACEVERVARLADAGGIDSIWTAAHLLQIPVTKLPREAPMLECYSVLAHAAAVTTRVTVGALVTCVMYRHPGMLLKQMTSLDVLSRGRTVFGIGVGWDVEEAEALGLPFAPVGERFERLEELLQLAHRMWTADESRFEGRHCTLGRPLNSPHCLQRPHPPILVAGGGERRTLRLVAQYADACNLFDLPAPNGVDIADKLRGCDRTATPSAAPSTPSRRRCSRSSMGMPTTYSNISPSSTRSTSITSWSRDRSSNGEPSSIRRASSVCTRCDQR
jgi:alkanesulfonate monooxygenase SsuD/methylene tetrahydromethanopterin reductase-like flavin-dependent oxidoreductase (luciferase family)